MQDPSANAVLGEATQLAADGDLAQAIVLLKGTIKAQPQLYPAWLMLSQCLFKAGYFEEASQVGQSAEQFDPLQADFQTIQSQMQQQAFAKAERSAQQMLAKQPGHPRAVFTLAHLAMGRGDAETGRDVLELGLRTSPANPLLRQMLLDSQIAVGDFIEAIETARTLATVHRSFEAQWTLVSVLLRFGQHQALLAACDEAKALAADDKSKLSQVDLVLGQTLRVLGQRGAAVEALKRSLDGNPGNADAWWALADMKNHTFSEAEISALQTLKNRVDAPAAVRCVASFADARAIESQAGIGAAMQHYQMANQLRRTAPYNRESVARDFAAIREAYTVDTLQTQANPELGRPKPIFIVGLPRSGSTLVEQILATHSQVEGTLEQPTLAGVERRAQRLCQRLFGNPLLDSLAAISTGDLGRLGDAYLQSGALFRTAGTPYFLDKMPFNFRLIGLIHKILPEAIVIDVRRNPMDCGLSLYKQYFTSGVEFSYDLADIGFFYNEYVRLMAHWDAVLPGKVLRVEYEALVNDPETEVRRLLAHVGVGFEPGCLTPHTNDRPVHTASSEQVREPISAAGIGMSSLVAGALKPLRDSLDA